ncbi:hypothetical protein AVEN_162184-1 [Araneus ventricosus]|uniref:Uncharacterized protein n=1 Tax=Araneus ventricosus TaxID=182803 RepID=A0A4Y2GZ57_ARAVE|nr:hypothetical protein AVEN_162184-1 [Araneus ventricosus]
MGEIFQERREIVDIESHSDLAICNQSQNPGNCVLGQAVMDSGKVSASVPGSKPDSTEGRRVCGPASSKLIRSGPNVQLRCRTHHLTEVRNYEFRPKIALILSQNGSSM